MKELAATDAFGLSPTLLKTQPSKFPSPLPYHYRLVGWTLAFICSSSFILGPILLFCPIISTLQYLQK